MIRCQTSWIVEIIMNSVKKLDAVEHWYFPCLYQFTPLKWLRQRNMTVSINSPVHSQALLFNSRLSSPKNSFKEEILAAFNQILMKNFDIKLNPFKPWLDIYFTKEQLNYLFYWHEAALELSDIGVRETFLSVVSQVINYWFSNNRAGVEPLFQPDEILAYYYRQCDNPSAYAAKFDVTEEPVAVVEGKDCSTAVFPLLFDDEDFFDDDTAYIYDAWLKGYTDINNSKRCFDNELNNYRLSLGSDNNFDFYKKMTIKAKTAVFYWSGNGIPPNLYKTKIVEPLQGLFKETYINSRLVYKAIDPIFNKYDYLLLFY